jgi:(2Fe-2S) ferredoxin
MQGKKATRLLICVDGPFCSKLCPPNHASQVVAALKQQIEERCVEAKFEIMPGGCLGMCGKGPNVRVFAESGHFAYCGVQPQDAAEIIDSHLDGDRLIERLRFKP